MVTNKEIDELLKEIDKQIKKNKTFTDSLNIWGIISKWRQKW